VPLQAAIQDRVINGKGRILVMDDEEVVRDVVGEMLKYLGYEVAFAHDGMEAILAYEKSRESTKRFDAIIMDLTIPGGMGGKEALKRLLELDPQIKAIVSSGYSHDPVMADYRKHGFADVVSKPYRIQDLAEVLNRVIPGKAPTDG
jgi:two-component system, cell cycle sensor histidine kinase and response regulator CckA